LDCILAFLDVTHLSKMRIDLTCKPFRYAVLRRISHLDFTQKLCQFDSEESLRQFLILLSHSPQPTKILHLGQQAFITFRALAPLHALPHVEELILKGNGDLSDSALEHTVFLSGLKKLNISGMKLTLKGFHSLRQIHRLDQLVFHNCAIYFPIELFPVIRRFLKDPGQFLNTPSTAVLGLEQTLTCPQ